VENPVREGEGGLKPSKESICSKIQIVFVCFPHTY